MIKETRVYVTLNGKHTKHYENLKYEIPRRRDKWGSYGFVQGTQIYVKIEDLPIKSEVIVTKICDYCFGESPCSYVTLIKGRQYIAKDCCDKVECVGQKIKEVNDIRPINKRRINDEKELEIGRSLSERFPEIATQYHPVLNKKPPDKISYGSDKMYWWICRDNPEHIWDDSAKHRTLGDRGCPFCRGMRINHTNCLRTTHPYLISEWHPTKNSEITPDNVSFGSLKMTWWLCPICTSSYDMPVAMRASAGQNCPYCAGSRVNETNCLATFYPELLREWNHELNIGATPYSITKSSAKKVWWKCSSCSWSWEAAPESRTNMKSGCPKCNSTDGEKEVMVALDKRNIKYKFQYSFSDLRSPKDYPMRYDFAIYDDNKNIKYIIEYDDPYHFKDERGRLHKKTVEYDKIKNEYCEIKGIKLLRIPYWDFQCIDDIIEKIHST
ncbi:hypothetical protein BC351_00610 [Paenibacillus ferrarius]|uniref:Zinc-ribbon domain-containing protein n=1 Tax=Paenibacillus ferrarius TaxID=1469647 RepID=A0A1V4HSC8_9BACL|nr:zinc-ribbon domain-containing protein [Paenibacillus ferrarius]OPH61776.1 hypothetical protein BC351_00610 [Paenibacillus ferrarius]